MVESASQPIGSSPREPLVTVAEAAAFLGVRVGTVYLWAETDRIPSYKIGNLRRFRLSDLEAQVQAQRAGPAADERPGVSW
jgi:excisionase family DNA binding protein